MGAGGQWNDRGAPEGGQGHTTWPQGGDSHNRYTERNKVCDLNWWKSYVASILI